MVAEESKNGERNIWIEEEDDDDDKLSRQKRTTRDLFGSQVSNPSPSYSVNTFFKLLNGVFFAKGLYTKVT